MSTTIDQKVVEMRFDNKQFENNARTSISTLAKLKQSLNLSGASKGLEDINAAARRVDIGGLSGSVDTLRARFSALQVMGVTALANITNSAVNAGKRITSALTIDPIKTGFQEYETQINAVQTILANTESKGTTLKDVNGALDELNTYTDKTIYNFTEMTRNIGTFTAAGVDLDTSVSAIKGIANLAAVSGSNSQQASTAMYQLSQALASGTVKLMDWNSVVNAGMGGQVFQDALKETARVHGIAIDDMIKKEGSFRETLSSGWLSSEILTETLAKFTGDLNEEQLKSMGYTDEQIKKIMKMGQTANDAATKVKTFTQLFDTLKEAAQSGWTQTWEILIGDFEEAKALLTEISDVISAIIGKSADSRNKLLQGWKDMGGRADMIDAFRNSFEAIGAIIKPISQAFRDIFPPATSKQLYNITAGIKSFTEKLKISDATAEKFRRTFKGVFSIFDMFRKVVSIVTKTIAGLFSGGGVTGLADLLLSITASIGDFFTSLNSGFKTDGISKSISDIATNISNILKKAAGSLEGFGDVLSKAGNGILKVIKNIWNGFKAAFSWISENVSAGDIFAGLAGGGIFVAAKKFTGLLDKIRDAIENIFGGKGDRDGGLKEKFADVLDSVHNTLQAFVGGIKAGALLSIAAAIAILSASLKSIAELSVPDITKSLFAIAAMMTMLNLSFKSIVKSLSKFNAKGIVKAGVSLILLASAIKILASAMVKMSSLSFKGIVKGLAGIGGGVLVLTKGLKAINKVNIKLSTSAALLALAKSCEMLGDALAKFGKMKWGEIKRGLVGMGGALGEFLVVLKGLGKVGGGKSLFGSVSLLIAVQSLGKLADGLKKFGEISWNEIGKGLFGMGGALAEVAGISGTLGKLSGFSGILGSASIVLAVQGLSDLADGFKKFGSMAWDEIKKGLVGMGGALGEVAGISGALGKLAGFSGLLGSGSILIAVQGLGDLADAFKKFGSMAWDEIKKGLVGMGGALTEVGIITGALGYLTNFAGLLGSGSIWVAVQGLGDLANAFKKFGEMSWDEIKRGLAGMGSALGELALGGLLNTLSIIGSHSISEMAEPLGILADSLKKWKDVTVPKGLGFNLGQLAWGIMRFTFGKMGASALAISAEAVGILADSVKKWTGVSVPAGLGENMGALAGGIRSFSFSGVGASALTSSASAVGTLADSIKKWSGVTIPPGLRKGLADIADGIESFSFAFVGGWSLHAIIGPLANLADSVKKWSGVTIPAGLEKGLKQMASGVKSFSFAFLGGWSINSLVSPLGALATSVKKWNSVSIPERLADQLKELASGVKSFSFAFLGGWAIDKLASPLESLATAVKKWSDVSIPDDLPDQMKSLASGMKLMDSLVKGINSKSGTVWAAINNVISESMTSVNSKASKFSVVGAKLSSMLASGLGKNSSKVKAAISKMLSSATNAISGYYSMFWSAGSYLVTGFANGIGANSYKAEAKARAMARAAEKGAKEELKEHSPSKVGYEIGDFFGVAFVNAISKYSDKAYNVSKDVASSAKTGLSEAVKKINNVVSGDMDVHPTIRPVLDLSNVKTGAKSIDGMFGTNPTIMANVGSISTAMARRGQNGENSDIVSAINRLRKDLGNVGGTSYHVDGITYDDGTNVSEAVKTLVRAAKVERRR